MSNGSESMSPEEFAKLMGAYPEPAHNPLPAYGGYMDNSPANFAWVNNNAYFGAEGKKNCGCGQDPCITYGADTDLTPTNHMNNSIGQVVPITNPMELPTNLIETEAGGGPEGQITPDTFGAESWSETDQYTIEYLLGYNLNVSLTDRVREMVNDEDIDLETLEWFLNNMEIPLGDKEEALEIITEAKGAETFEAGTYLGC